MDDNEKLTKLIENMQKDEGKTDIAKLGVAAGYTRAESLKKVPYLLIQYAQFAKNKVAEVTKTLTRGDVRDKISNVLSEVGNKITTMMTSATTIDPDLAKALTVFNSTFDRYTKLEGMNKAEKFDLNITDYDLDNLDVKEKGIFLKLLEKVRIKEEK